MKPLPRFWIWLFKILVIAGSYSYIYYQLVYGKNDLSQWHSYPFNLSKTVFLALAVLLMAVNWSLEAIKWQLLVRPIEKISVWRSLEGVIIGLTTSIFTPNRTGEYFGRIWVLSQQRVQGIFATITGSIAQISITLIAGIFSLFFFATEQFQGIEVLDKNKNLMLVISSTLLFFILILLFALPTLSKKLKRFKKIYHFISFFKHYSTLDILKILLLSTFRYGIFILQFFLLMHIFDISLSFEKVFLSLALIYFAMAFIPSFTLAEIGIRGSLAITIFSIFVANTTGIFLAISLLWLINIALPAIVGSFFLLKLKLNNAGL